MLVGRDPGLQGVPCASLLGTEGDDDGVDGAGSASASASTSTSTSPAASRRALSAESAPVTERPGLCIDLIAVEAGRIVRSGDHGLTEAEADAVFHSLMEPTGAGESSAVGALATGHWRRVAPHRIVLELAPGVDVDGLVMWSPAAGLGRTAASCVPTGPGSRALRAWMDHAAAILKGHEVLATRRDAGLPVPTHAWPWGGGRGHGLHETMQRYEGRPATVVANDPIGLGFGRAIGADVRRVPLDPSRFVAELVAAATSPALAFGMWSASAVPGEADQADADIARSADERVSRIELIDERIIGPLAVALAGQPETWRLLVVAGPVRDPATGARVAGAIPAVFAGMGFASPRTMPFDASLADDAELRLRPGDDVVEFLLYGAGVRRPRTPRRPHRRRQENGRAQ
ncbi:MAG: hypothetical protein AB8G96_08565 [Phycisphaerales bacterium]